ACCGVWQASQVERLKPTSLALLLQGPGVPRDDVVLYKRLPARGAPVPEHAAEGADRVELLGVGLPHVGLPVAPADSWMTSMTSVACSSTCSGMVSPSAWAVLRLMMKSNSRGCSTGRSAGLVPLRTRSA